MAFANFQLNWSVAQVTWKMAVDGDLGTTGMVPGDSVSAHSLWAIPLSSELH